MDFIEDVKTFIIERFLFGDSSQLNEDTSFLKDSIMDSTGILELVTFIEEKYNITINDDELLPENFDSLNNINDFLKGKRENN